VPRIIKEKMITGVSIRTENAAADWLLVTLTACDAKKMLSPNKCLCFGHHREMQETSPRNCAPPPEP
jgi:hypothetical protein